MKTRAVFEPWRNTNERYVAEVWHDSSLITGRLGQGSWIEIDRYGDDSAAKHCAALFAKGPEVIAEYDSATDNKP